MGTEIKVLACWAASWAAGLGVFFVGSSPIDRIEPGYGLAAYVGFLLVVSLGGAAGAWLAVTRWWPENGPR